MGLTCSARAKREPQADDPPERPLGVCRQEFFYSYLPHIYYNDLIGPRSARLELRSSSLKVWRKHENHSLRALRLKKPSPLQAVLPST